MDNEVAIHQISGYLGWEDLKTCRQLSKPWYRGCQTEWLHRAPVKELWKYKQGSDAVAIGKNSAAVLLGVDWSACAKWDGALKYQKFMLEGLSFDTYWNNLQYSDFWDTRGKYLTYLEIQDSIIISENACTGIILYESTPNLKTLKLVRIQFKWSATRGPDLLEAAPKDNSVMKLQSFEVQYTDKYKILPVSWTVLFQRFSNLQKLSLANYINTELGRVIEGLDAFLMRNRTRHPIKCMSVQNLSTLDVCGAMSLPVALLDKFREQSRPGATVSLVLQEFGVGSNWMRCGRLNELLELVARHGELTKLIIKEGFSNFDFGAAGDTNVPKQPGYLSLPWVEKLTRLDLWDFDLRGFQFLLQCPNLQQCNIIANATMPVWLGRRNYDILRNEYVSSGWGKKEREQIYLPHLTAFHCNHHLNFHGSDFELLARWMPNLKSLMISVAPYEVEAFWSNFGNLRRLFICNNQVTDQGYTGINTCDPDSYQRHANLTHLAALQELVVEKPEVEPTVFQFLESVLTELSVREAFCKAPSLKKLYISSHAISENGMTILKSEFKGDLNTTKCPSFMEFINSFDN